MQQANEAFSILCYYWAAITSYFTLLHSAYLLKLAPRFQLVSSKMEIHVTWTISFHVPCVFKSVYCGKL